MSSGISIKAADLFCGAGGTSKGLMKAAESSGVSIDLTAVNHWPVAVDTHSENHPAARHLCASLDSLNPRDLFREGELEILWASPECTHHSIARGGKPISDQSRASAWCVVRWTEALLPKVVQIENVKEFISWGPLGANGKPLKRKKGDIFKAFIKALESLGYRVEWRILCAADYGDPTTRRRLFIYAVRGSAPNRWPEPTHHQTGANGLAPWIPARDVIDWTDKGRSVFQREKPLAEKTMRRILIGLEKYGLASYMVNMKGQSNGADVNAPAPTVTAHARHLGICDPFLVHLRGTGTATPVENPVRTVAASGQHIGLAQPFLVQTNHTNGDRVKPVSDPLPTVAGNRGEWSLCSPYVVRYNGEKRDSEARVQSVDAPLTTLDTSNRFAVAQPYLVKYYGSGIAKDVESPLDAVTTKPRYGLCQPVIEINGEQYLLDILFRMLKPSELALAQGFPADYRFKGNTTEVVKQIGNAVPTNLAAALGRSAIDHLLKGRRS
jgi:DNA (cytosine-5)-methyltransferase 1